MSMKSEIRHIAHYVKQNMVEGQDVPVIDLIDRYFTDPVTWSNEKEEWSKMDQEQRQAFADKLTAVKSTPAKRVAAIVKVAKKKVSGNTGGTKVSKKKVPMKLTKPTTKNGKVTKMDLAKGVFKKLAGKGRQEVLAALMKDAKLTKAGAQTYYYLLLKKS